MNAFDIFIRKHAALRRRLNQQVELLIYFYKIENPHRVYIRTDKLLHTAV